MAESVIRNSAQQATPTGGENWANGPRSLFIKRCDHGFGFTLRHFIVYPPESYTIFPGDSSGAPVAQAMDTIFVKQVHKNTPASEAGLSTGDRIVSVNGENITGHSYAEVVQLIQQSSTPYLHLVVVPRDHDILQLYFGATAHNPETNQRPASRHKSPGVKSPGDTGSRLKSPGDTGSRLKSPGEAGSRLKSPGETGTMQKASAIPARVHHSGTTQQKHKSIKHRQSLTGTSQPARPHPSLDRPRQSLDNIRQPSDQLRQPLDNTRRTLDRPCPPLDNTCPTLDRPGQPLDNAQQQPLNKPIGSENHGTTARYRTPSRRASEGNNVKRDAIYGNSYYTDNILWSQLGAATDQDMVMSRTPHTRPNVQLLTPSGSETSGSSSSLQGLGYSSSNDSRRESNSSLPSRENLTDSKDSLSSFDSTSTLTGHEHSSDDSLIMSRIRKSFEQKEEFLRRPTTPIMYADPDSIPIIAREFYARPQKMKPVWPPNDHNVSFVARPSHHNVRRVKSEMDHERDVVRAKEGEGDALQFAYGGAVSNVSNQDPRGNRSQQRSFVNTLSRIHENRTTDLTNGDGETVSLPSSPNEELYSRSSESPNDDANRYNHHGPLIQLVSRRARQFESGHLADEHRTLLYKSELARLSSKRSVPNVALRKKEIEARSGSGERERERRETTTTAEVYNGLSANCITMIGSKNIHCQPPSDLNFPPETPAGQHLKSPDASNDPPSLAPLTRPNQLSLSNPLSPITPSIVVQDSAVLTHTDTEALIEALDQAAAKVPKVSSIDLDSIATTVVRRQKNPHHNLAAEDERLRRTSYLRATNSDRMNVDSDHEYSDSELQARSANRKWRPPLFPDDIQQLRQFFEEGVPLRRPITARHSESSVPTTHQENKENEDQSPVKEGWLQCKITVIDGKRASDRSWRQVWAVLSNQTLSLFKDRPDPSQSSALSEPISEPQVIDVACSQAEVSGSYTKKKHAVRLNTLSCSELLLQAEDALDAQSWLSALQEQATIKEEGNGANRLSPQTGKGLRKLTSFRNRSPTGQSPVNKTLKPSHAEPLASPKTKTWKGRVARQFRRIQHSAGSPSSPTAPNPEGSTIGILLEDCPPSEVNEFVPFLVVKCATIVEERGLDIIGIYRVPGNTAAVSSLTEAVNKGFQFITYQDPRWNDVNVISSLLKLFFRRLPDALLTSELYPLFIDADKMEDPNKRITSMRRLVHELPDHHFETLKFLCMHLKRVIQHSSVNKMEARNLAIVFGPTLVRTADNNMVTMVTDMSHQCRIVESLLLYTDWFFSDEDLDKAGSFPFPLQQDSAAVELEASAINHSLLLSNIQKVEGMKGESSGKDILAKVIGSSIISAANRKMQKAKFRKGATNAGSGGGAVTPSGDDSDNKKRKELREASLESDPTSLVASSILESAMLSGNIVKTLRAEGDDSAPLENSQQPTVEVVESPTGFEDGTIRTYAGLSATTQERIRKFELETKAMLQRDLTRQRREPDNASTTQQQKVETDLQEARKDVDKEVVNQSVITSQSTTTGAHQSSTITRAYEQLTHTSLSTSSHLNTSPSRKSTDSTSTTSTLDRASVTRIPSKAVTNIHVNPIDQVDASCGLDDGENRTSKKHQHKENRQGSVETAAGAADEAKATGRPQAVSISALKRFKTGKEQLADPAQLVSSLQCSSLDSLQEALGADRLPNDLSDDGGSDLLSSLTSTFDRKLKSLLKSTPTELANQQAPSVSQDEVTAEGDVEVSVPLTPTYRDPSLHRDQSLQQCSVTSQLPMQDSADAPKADKDLIRRRWLQDENPSMETTGTIDTSSIIPTSEVPEAETVMSDLGPSEEVKSSKELKDDEARSLEELKDIEPRSSVGFHDSEARVLEVLKAAENRLSMSNGSTVVFRRETTSNAKRPESLKVGSKEYSKLKRSESLTKADKVESSAANAKLKRSESLTKAEDKQNAKLKRSDSLTKTEKTESNISKRRQAELVSNRRKEKENVVTTKLKRKNGMPERSIKRRHTVGGTKDFDKLNWLDNRLQQEQLDQVAINELTVKERRCLRTSSPDLSSSRLNSLRGREGFLVEIRSRQQAARPQSLVETNNVTRTFKMGLPLESHV